MFQIKCPQCQSVTLLSLADQSYDGPFRCWKCRGTFLAVIDNEKLKSCEPISEEEFEQYT